MRYEPVARYFIRSAMQRSKPTGIALENSLIMESAEAGGEDGMDVPLIPWMLSLFPGR